MARQFTVIHVVRALQTGGLETLVLEMCRRMDALDSAQAGVCALLPGDGLERRPEYRRVRCQLLSGRQRRHWVATIRALTGLFRQTRPDVVHVHNWFSHVRAVPAARLAGVPVVVATKHGVDFPRLLGSRRLAGWFYRRADALVAVSRDAREGLLDTYRLREGKVRLILNGIDSDRFRPGDGSAEQERRRVLGITGRPMLGTVCRLGSEKGVPTLLEAFRSVLDSLPEAVLVVAGDGPERAACERVAARLKLSGSVRFLGNREDVAEIYPLLDVYVQPSYTEGISLTMLEACSCALPVVATRVGGNPEILLEGETGLLVPPGDADALADAVRRIWRNQQRAKAMGRAARERVVQSFSLNRMVDDYLGLYRELYDRKVPKKRPDAVGDRNGERVCLPAERPITER